MLSIAASVLAMPLWNSCLKMWWHVLLAVLAVIVFFVLVMFGSAAILTWITKRIQKNSIKYDYYEYYDELMTILKEYEELVNKLNSTTVGSPSYKIIKLQAQNYYAKLNAKVQKFDAGIPSKNVTPTEENLIAGIKVFLSDTNSQVNT